MVTARRIAERTVLALMAAAGVIIPLAGLFGWLDGTMISDNLPKITLLILSTVTVFLLMEVDRLKVVDDIHQVVTRLDVDAIARDRLQDRYGGVTRVHRDFAAGPFVGHLATVRSEVVILQTWIPNLDDFAGDLRRAIEERAVQVRVMLLFPTSPVAGLRDEALRTGGAEPLGAAVGPGVEDCLNTFAAVHARLPGDLRGRLRVHVYNSLPSVAAYKVDDRYFVSSFLHSKLAIRCAQIEIDGGDTEMGREVQRELDTIWSISRRVDLDDWRTCINNITWRMGEHE
ncbi:hypothetical protein [Nonomuraea typhae]|uniref:hypothetical protein n=1 Tax=Nonomuraea typhae TaxID=2603600 RepID=UPI0012FCE891|nr:hypothetical protein [Nonomuraea typhae]